MSSYANRYKPWYSAVGKFLSLASENPRPDGFFVDSPENVERSISSTSKRRTLRAMLTDVRLIPTTSTEVLRELMSCGWYSGLLRKRGLNSPGFENQYRNDRFPEVSNDQDVVQFRSLPQLHAVADYAFQLQRTTRSRCSPATS